MGQLSFSGTFAIADINGDGVQDLIATQVGTPNIAISLGDGTHPGTFLTPYFVGVLTMGTNALAVADLNGDGHLDIVYGASGDNFAGILFQDPLHPGTFISGYPLSTSFAYPLIADVNQDGNPDIVLYLGNRGVILFGDGSHRGSYLLAVPLVVGQGGVSSALLVDMNGDGLPDLLTSNDVFSRTVSISLNDSRHPGNLLPARDYPATNFTDDLAVGDLNGDGLPDVVLGGTTSNIVVLLSDAAHPGTLLSPNTYLVATTPTGTEPSGIALADVNGDGKLDVVVGNYGSAFNLLLGNGDGTLSLSISYPTGPIPKTFWSMPVAVADIDGDGLQDVLIGQYFQNSVQLFLHRPSTVPLAVSATDQTLNASAVRPGDAVTLAIKVSAFQGIPSGTITLYSVPNAQIVATYTPIAVLPLDSTGIAIYADRFQSGAHTFRSFYPGDQTFAPSTSLFDTATVTANPTVNVSIAATPNPAAPGQNVVLLTTVSPMSPAPTGTIVLLDNGGLIGSVPLSVTGTAIFNTSSLTLGTHTITASYSGDTVYVPQQASTTETIRYPAVQLTLTSSLNPATIGQSITFQAKASATRPVPTGTVSFRDNGVLLFSAPLMADGTAALTTAVLAVGNHPIQAIYSGDANYDSQSAMLTEVVLAPAPPPPAIPVDYTLANGRPLTLSTLRTGTVTLTATPLNGLADVIALSCGSLPLYVACRVVPSSVTLANGVPQQAAVQIALDQFPGGNGLQPAAHVLFIAAFPLLCLALPLRLRNQLRLAASILALAFLPALAGLAGCGYGKLPLVTPPGTYTITLNGHGAGSNLNRSTMLTLIVE